ncbi:DNA-binding NarL/FixJ family response regulator [Duganella sp. 1224]|uniref:response regulator transcription factor n=1 Tax=Duganella sp. 1224 TaxID=2587052 RepID=UPI0015C85D3B|nr:response regulator transcription factor [Duganella sp. 1224]NYE63403.1 DNA-binding NarL/FixJ family response regulator [Duganella sp. 1224]
MHLPIKIAVTHGHPIVAAGLQALLNDSAGVTLCGDDAHIVITDRQRGMALLAAPALASRRVLVVAEHDGVWEARQAIAAGIHGYVLHSASREQLLAALRALHQGEGYVAPGLLPPLEAGGSLPLTSRERDVLTLIAQGCGNKAIARTLEIGLGTVKSHNKQLYAKLGAKTRTQAMLLARRQGLIADK